MRRFECHDIALPEGSERFSQAAVLSVEVISNDRSNRDSNLHGPVDEFQCDREFGPKARIVLALFKMVSGSIGFKIDWVIDALVCPQARYRDHSVVDLAQIAQVLSAHMSHMSSRFAISMLINDKHSMACRRSEEHTSELQSHLNLVCRLLLEKKKKNSNDLKCETPQMIIA